MFSMKLFGIDARCTNKTKPKKVRHFLILSSVFLAAGVVAKYGRLQRVAVKSWGTSFIVGIPFGSCFVLSFDILLHFFSYLVMDAIVGRLT